MLIVAAAALAIFAYWGIYTAAGRQAYDEMAGMVPFFAGILSAASIFCALVLLSLSRKRSSRLRDGH